MLGGGMLTLETVKALFYRHFANKGGSPNLMNQNGIQSFWPL